MTTRAGSDEFKGNKLFAIYKEDEYGNIIGDRPIVSFGKRKAQALLNHLEDFKSWCEEEGIEQNEWWG